jgi:WD40 repeat protein
MDKRVTFRLALVCGLVAVVVPFATMGAWALGQFTWHPMAPAALSGGVRPERDGPATLPGRVGVPGLWTADGARHPIGAASVLLTGNTWYFDGSRFSAGLVGAGSDTYRVLAGDGVAGMQSVLSPDGGRLASPDGIVDLATGRRGDYPAQWADRDVAAQAWSPDGTRLAVVLHGVADEAPSGVADLSSATLVVLEPATGSVREIAPLDPGRQLDGWTVAFSPDGRRLAYQQSGDRLRIVPLAGGASTDMLIPDGSWLAGKGAWTRDGRSLLVVSGERCDCGDYPVRWTVRTMPSGPSYRLDGAYAVRVLGWWPSGRPVAAAYAPTGEAAATLFDDPAGRDALVHQDDVGSARLLELDPAGRHRLLLDSGTESLDVPDAVLGTGAMRPGRHPYGTLADVFTVIAGLFATSVLILLAIGVRAAVARRRRRV